MGKCENSGDLGRSSLAKALSELDVATESKLGEFSSAGPRSSFPLQSLQAEAYVRERAVLVGDAAHTIHPMAGQGVNLGLYDAAALAEVLQTARDAGRSIHSRQTLRRFERWRRGHNSLMNQTMDGFFRLFGSERLPVKALRRTGLGMVSITGSRGGRIILPQA